MKDFKEWLLQESKYFDVTKYGITHKQLHDWTIKIWDYISDPEKLGSGYVRSAYEEYKVGDFEFNNPVTEAKDSVPIYIASQLPEEQGRLGAYFPQNHKIVFAKLLSAKDQKVGYDDVQQTLVHELIHAIRTSINQNDHYFKATVEKPAKGRPGWYVVSRLKVGYRKKEYFTADVNLNQKLDIKPRKGDAVTVGIHRDKPNRYTIVDIRGNAVAGDPLYWQREEEITARSGDIVTALRNFVVRNATTKPEEVEGVFSEIESYLRGKKSHLSLKNPELEAYLLPRLNTSPDKFRQQKLRLFALLQDMKQLYRDLKEKKDLDLPSFRLPRRQQKGAKALGQGEIQAIRDTIDIKKRQMVSLPPYAWDKRQRLQKEIAELEAKLK